MATTWGELEKDFNNMRVGSFMVGNDGGFYLKQEQRVSLHLDGLITNIINGKLIHWSRVVSTEKPINIVNRNILFKLMER